MKTSKNPNHLGKNTGLRAISPTTQHYWNSNKINHILRSIWGLSPLMPSQINLLIYGVLLNENISPESGQKIIGALHPQAVIQPVSGITMLEKECQRHEAHAYGNILPPEIIFVNSASVGKFKKTYARPKKTIQQNHTDEMENKRNNANNVNAKGNYRR